MNLLISMAGSLGLMALIYIMLILAELSQRLGAVTKMPRYYLGFYVSAAFVGVALISRFLKISALPAPQQNLSFLVCDLFYLLTYHIPLAIGATISLALTLRYWGWLFKER